MKNISKQALQAYKTLLKYSQLSLNNQINFRNVNVKNDAHIHQIYTINNTKQQLPHLVLLHGFAGSAMSYIRTFHNLSKHFNVHALDHYGNGFSSRQAYDINKTHQQMLNLYVDSIQQWRKQTGIKKFVLAGHSFGGYIACSYMLENRNIVDRLVLLSPVGTSSPSQIHKQIQGRKSQSLKNKIALSLFQKVYNISIQPSKLFKLPVIGDYLVGQFLKSTIKLQDQQKQMWKQYIKYISNQQSHLQKSFYRCFQWPFVSKVTSISQIIQKIVQSQKQKPIQFYYGQNDWMEQVAAKKLTTNYSNVHHEIIQNATHNMVFDYPYDVVDRIIAGPMKNRIQLAKL